MNPTLTVLMPQDFMHFKIVFKMHLHVLINRSLIFYTIKALSDSCMCVNKYVTDENIITFNLFLQNLQMIINIIEVARARTVHIHPDKE